MINTYDIKIKQFSVFRTGNENSKDIILIIGSCRSVPYLNYLNKLVGHSHLIYFIDPFNYNWDENDKFCDMEAVINSLENDQNLLNIFKSTKIFIHEFYANFGLFNCSKLSNKNIYQFGMNPEIDICIPNFHDIFILDGDFENLDANYRLQDDKVKYIQDNAEKNLNKFYMNCFKSSFPEFAKYFKDNWLNIRLFCSFNHISKNYTFKIFELMNEKFLKFDVNLSSVKDIDMYSNTETKLTDIDYLAFKYNWDEKK